MEKKIINFTKVVYNLENEVEVAAQTKILQDLNGVKTVLIEYCPLYTNLTEENMISFEWTKEELENILKAVGFLYRFIFWT